MSLIEAIAAIIVSIFVAVFSRQAADEFKAWAPWIIGALMRRAVNKLPGNQRDRYAEEWQSHVDEIPGDIGKLFIAVSLLRAAWRLSRILPTTTFAAEVAPPVPVFSGWPATVTLASNSAAGTIVASGLIVMSDGNPFTGTVTITDEAGNEVPLLMFQP